MTSPEESTEPITITGVGHMVLDLSSFNELLDLLGDNPDHPVEEEVQADG